MCGTVPPALADEPSEPASEPGVVEERIRRETEQRLIPEVREPTIQEAAPPVAPPEPPQIRLVLKEVAIEGNTILAEEVFAPAIAPYLNREVTAQELQELPQAIERVYRRQGYVTSVAFLPPQRIQEGRVTIQVLEGRLGKVTIEGNRYFSAHRILWYWPMESGQILQYRAIRGGLIRMNEHPDREVQALLKPGAATGQTDIVLKVTDERPLHAGFQWDRQGTKPIGRFRYGPYVRHNNLLGLDDILIGGMTFGRHFAAAYAQYLVPLTPYGTTASFGFSHSQVSPKRHFDALGVNGIAQSYVTSLTQVLLDDEPLTLDARVSFDIKESRTMVRSGTSRRERLRVIRFGPRMRLRDPWGMWVMRNDYSFGLKGLGATSANNPVASRPGAKPDFFSTELSATRIQQMPWGTRTILTLETQVAGSKLLPQEQLYLGGADSVRGYPEGDYLADSGLLFRLEYLVPCVVAPADWRLPFSKESLREQVTFAAFVDRGYGRLRAITGEERQSRNLTGVGGGVRIRLAELVVARLDWAWNVGDKPLTDDADSVLHFSLHQEF